MTHATFSALAEPNRFNIIELLRDYGAMTVSEIAQRLGLKLPQSSKHLHVLAEAGLVKVQIDVNRRIYSLCPSPFVKMNEWLASSVLPIVYLILLSILIVRFTRYKSIVKFKTP